MIYLSKIAPLFVLPLGITIGLIAIGMWRGHRWMVWLAAGLLWLSSTPAIGDRAMAAAEGGAERVAAADASTADVIVVLSTGRTPAPGRAGISEWTDADRFFAGVELFKADKAPLLLFTGGWAPWQGDAPLEGDVLAAAALGFGIPADRILKTGRVSNTADEARAVAELLRAAGHTHPRVLLVTSAFHLERAGRLFRHAGLDLVGFPVDFWRTSANGSAVMTVLPNASALVQTQVAMRELYGRLYYRLLLWSGATGAAAPRQK